MSEYEKGENTSLEKGIVVENQVQVKAQYVSIPLFGKLTTDASNRLHFDVHDLDRVQRRLKQRHVQM